MHIDEDVSIDKNDKKDKARIDSQLIQKYIFRSRLQGINFCVFVQKDWTKKITIWVQKWSTWTSNDVYFGDLAKKYNATKITLTLSDFIKTSFSKKRKTLVFYTLKNIISQKTIKVVFLFFYKKHSIDFTL